MRPLNFVQIADVLDGIPGRTDEGLFAETKKLISSVGPAPDFLLFNGDHVAGYCSLEELRSQWNYFLRRESMDYPFPVYHVPGNHDVVSLTETLPNPYGRSFPNAEAEELFREAFPEIPENSPEGQKGLSYFVEGEEYILIILHAIYSSRSSTGFKEGEWLDKVLKRFKDKPIKLVASHFPVFPVNGYDRHAPYPHASWIINPREGRVLWDILERHRVTAFLCAHVCAFDFQVHRNIPQICSAGGGHRNLYPGYAEYHHISRFRIDEKGLRVRTVDHTSAVREECEWPAEWSRGLKADELRRLTREDLPREAAAGERWEKAKALYLRISGTAAVDRDNTHGGDKTQTILAGWDNEIGQPLLWIGIPAEQRRFTIRALLFPQDSAVEYPVTYTGPVIEGDFDIELVIDKRMGPGGVLYRMKGDNAWDSLPSSSSLGFALFRWPPLWDLGGYQYRFPYRGKDLLVQWKVFADR